MTKNIDKRAPDLEKETPDVVDNAMLKSMHDAFKMRRGVDAKVYGRIGKNAAAMCVVEGDDRHAHEIMAFTRGAEAWALLIDYMDGLLADMTKKGGPKSGRFLPLDWEGRPYDDDVVFVRGEVRDYVAETEAAKLLGDPAPKRGI